MARDLALEPIGRLNTALHQVIVGSVSTMLGTVFRLSLADTRPLPAGPVIVAANHRSFLDPMIVGSTMTRRVFFIMAREHYEKPIFNRLYRLERCIPVDVETDNRGALRAGKAILDHGRVLGIFPEGQITRDGRLAEGQPGVAWLAQRTGAPIVPLYLGGTREAMPSFALHRVRPRKVTMRMGATLRASDFAPGRAGQEALTDALMSSIAELGGEVYPPER